MGYKKSTSEEMPSYYTCARRFELPTPWSVAKCSIQLSYAHIFVVVVSRFPLQHYKFYCISVDLSRVFLLFLKIYANTCKYIILDVHIDRNETASCGNSTQNRWRNRYVFGIMDVSKQRKKDDYESGNSKPSGASA